jgi:hypothetical protein
MEYPMEFANDHEVAEARHGEVKRACLDRIDPGNTSRWGHRDDSDEEVARVLATIAWESGWDEAVLASQRAQVESIGQLIAQRDVEHEAARAWCERYERQLWQTQDLDQRWQAKLRDAQDALVKMKAERNEARADAAQCAMAYRDKLPIGGILKRIDAYARGMSADGGKL